MNARKEVYIMENFVFSLNATMPVFFVMVAGYLLKKANILDDNFVNVSNKFNFKFTLPILLIVDLGTSDFSSMWDTKYVIFCFGVTLLCILLALLIAFTVFKDKTYKGEFVQSSYRGSAAVLGIAYMQNIYGSAGMIPLMMLGAVPLYNIAAVIILTIMDPSKKDDRDSGKRLTELLKDTVAGIITNPIIIGIVVGFLISVFKISLPQIVNKTLGYFADISTPLALVSLGAGFELKEIVGQIKPVITASFFKLVLQPLIFLPVAAAFGYHDEKMAALIIMLGAPSTVSTYVMSKNMGHEGVVSSGCIVVTTLFSSLTITLCIFALKSLGLL